MKRLITFFCSFCLLMVSTAQVQKYHRVRIYTGENGLFNLAELGLSVDHGDLKKGYSFTSDFSDAELALIKRSGLKFETLIADVSGYYAHQNDNAGKNAQLLSTSCTDCPQFQTPSNFNLGSMGGFFTYQEMLDNLDSMAAKYPNLITLRQTVSPNTTVEGRNLYYVKISDNPNVNETESQVLYTSLHHA
ncbi:MAG: M14 family zinc carboxypeptidase, partial [Bacteroidia bacterium]